MMEGTFDSQPGTACHMPANVTPGAVGCRGNPPRPAQAVGPEPGLNDVARSPVPQERPLHLLERIIERRLW